MNALSLRELLNKLHDDGLLDEGSTLIVEHAGVASKIARSRMYLPDGTRWDLAQNTITLFVHKPVLMSEVGQYIDV